MFSLNRAIAPARLRHPRGTERRRGSRAGVTLPIIVLLLATLIGMAAFAIDISRMYVIRAQLQTAADAGALAGAERLLDQSPGSAADSAFAYASRNLVDRTAPEVPSIVPGHWAFPGFTPTGGFSDPSTNAVQVTTGHTGNYIFAPIYRIFNRTLGATAIAALGSTSRADCIRPLAIPYEDLLAVLYPPHGTKPVSYDLTTDDVKRLATLTVANEILLKVGDAALTPVGGNFYAVREPPIRYSDGSSDDPWTGGNDYRHALSASCADMPARVGVGDWLQAEQGNMQGPTRQGIADLCKISGNPASFRCDTPRTIRIAIWDIADKSIAAPNAFHVKYLGDFVLTGFSAGAGGTLDGVTGYFSTMVAGGGFDSHPGPLRNIALVR